MTNHPRCPICRGMHLGGTRCPRLIDFLLDKLTSIDAAAALATDDTVRETVRKMVKDCFDHAKAAR